MKIAAVVARILLLGLFLGSAVAADPALSDADRQFIEAAHQLALQEVNASHLATVKGAAATVQILAKQMVEDHEAAHQDLEKLAKQLGVALGAKIDEARADKVRTLQKLAGAEFDRQYVSDEITDHTVAIETFEKAAAATTNAAIKDFATRRVKAMQKNLQAARATLSKL
ncbi:MAG TPA: DUF4142 domain-containing protein [Nevskiaceae bacterium]|nr:DUF4142 domain-containing protein [Nevskiaceae bacterium]